VWADPPHVRRDRRRSPGALSGLWQRHRPVRV